MKQSQATIVQDGPPKQPGSPPIVKPVITMPTIDPRVYVRDTIVVNEAFKATLTAEIAHRKLKVGTKLTVAARTIRHDPNYELSLDGYPLLVVADTYDGKGGAIDTSGKPGAVGATGAHGAPGLATQGTKKPGGPGRQGGVGGAGAAASPITLIARSISNLRLIAKGGAGGHGGAGGKGGEGGRGKTFGTGEHDPPEIVGTAGGAGGPGGNGAAGGKGAQITVHCFTKLQSLHMDGAGGAGGQGGAGGKPGPSYDDSAVAPISGKPGPKGPAGASVAPVQSQTSLLDSWWSTAVKELGSAAGRWAEHRTSVGEYLWRVKNQRSAAFVEFDSAVRLWAHPGAARLRGYIEANQSPIGLPYDHDLKPVFPRFERFITDYGPMIQGLTSVATTLLVHSADVEGNKQRLEDELAHVRGVQSTTVNGVASAQSGVIFAEGELSQNQTRIDRTQEELAEVKQAMEEEAEPDAFEVLVGIATAVIEIVGAFYTGGATLLALPASIGLIADAANVLEQKLWDETTGTYNIDATSFAEWKDSAQFKEMVGGLEDLAARGKAFYDKAKTVAELFETEVDEGLVQRYKELTIELIELGFQRRQLQLLRLQGELALDSANQIALVAIHDEAAVQQQLESFTDNIALLARIARSLMRSAQVYVDLYTKYEFLAARALELWTLRDGEYTPQVSFGRGYVHPDDEAEAFMVADRGPGDGLVDTSGNLLLKLLQDYQNGVKDLLTPANLRDAYESYRDSLKITKKHWNITEPETLEALRTKGETTVRLRLSSFADNRVQLKVDKLYVSLVGAVADNETVIVNVEHTGHAENRREVGKPLILSMPPCDDFVVSRLDEGLGPVLEEEGQQKFWGRSPAALWRVTIDPTRSAGLNLTNLTELQIVIYYQFVEVP